MTAAHAEALFLKAEHSLKGLEKDLADGKVVSVDGFDQIVRGLCDTIATLPPKEARRFEERLNALAAGLGTIGEQMQTMRDALSTQLRGVSTQRQAQTAYRKTEVSGGA